MQQAGPPFQQGAPAPYQTQQVWDTLTRMQYRCRMRALLFCVYTTHLQQNWDVQGGWSFTGPPPGLPMQPQPFHFYQAYPPMGMVGAPRPPPMMNMNIPPRPNMPPTHPPPSMHLSQPSQWMGKMLQPFPTNPAVLAAGPGAHPIEKKYVRPSPYSCSHGLLFLLECCPHPVAMSHLIVRLYAYFRLQYTKLQYVAVLVAPWLVMQCQT